ncbi:MAG: terminase [Oscillospiraceae bacterium]|nr:terminase [Oscillospiraceae bacterium]
MSEVRLGKQTPTICIRLPYTESLGTEAVDLYNQSDRTAQDWQALMLEDIMAVNDSGLWVHMKYGWSIPRRNGKSEILIMRAIWDLTHERRCLYTAHRESTAASAWEKVLRLLTKMGYREDEDFKAYKSAGRRSIEWLKDGSEAVINFRTRSSTGGLGEGYDTLIIDEAQEYTADQESALKYVVTDSKNPQTLMCGTPPTAVSSGDVFLKYRRRCLTGKEEDAGWAEWSVPNLTDAHDPELWYLTNPSLGTILTERTIRSELGDDQVDDNIQRLGLWLRYSQKSAISKQEWSEYALKEKPILPKKPRIFFAVKYGHSGNVSLAAAVKLDDGRIFIEAIDCRPVRDGNAWLMPFLRNPHAESVVIDGAGNQTVLASEMKDAGVKCKAVLPKVADVVAAHALFEQQLFGGQIRHMDQPALAQAATNCEHRAIGSGGGFGYTSVLEGADISLLEAVSLAHWLCANAKEHKPQRVSY